MKHWKYYKEDCAFENLENLWKSSPTTIQISSQERTCFLLFSLPLIFLSSNYRRKVSTSSSYSRKWNFWKCIVSYLFMKIINEFERSIQGLNELNYWSKDGFEDEILESDPLPSLIEGGENFAFKRVDLQRWKANFEEIWKSAIWRRRGPGFVRTLNEDIQPVANRRSLDDL